MDFIRKYSVVIASLMVAVMAIAIPYAYAQSNRAVKICGEAAENNDSPDCVTAKQEASTRRLEFVAYGAGGSSPYVTGGNPPFCAVASPTQSYVAASANSAQGITLPDPSTTSPCSVNYPCRLNYTTVCNDNMNPANTAIRVWTYDTTTIPQYASTASGWSDAGTILNGLTLDRGQCTTFSLNSLSLASGSGNDWGIGFVSATANAVLTTFSCFEAP